MASGFVAALGWLPREFDRPPEPGALRDGYLIKLQAETKLLILDTMVEAYDSNERAINEKLGSFRSAAVVFGVAVFLIGISAISEIIW